MEPAPLDASVVSLVAGSCLCRRIQQASRTVGKRFDEAFRPVGLSNWQFTLLMALAAPKPRTVSQVAADLGMDRTTATKNLQPLERRGLVEIRADVKDRRVRRITLTREGQALLGEAIARWRTVNEAVAAPLSRGDLAALMSGLEAISAEQD
ncbi:MarR family winged helix-turn-helix transcriptional regulator [Azorhizobium doebereinerae]|uniref:MarR family winged helix-turn-helix transcriptional regulator n=1 Tax=Azorhizobium doebereinerae TaxID=281091 RepID=UPI000414D527|nr:MarR family winged helix-turn-helix transcriptional regulator [Azorhizobium doebereinerae]